MKHETLRRLVDACRDGKPDAVAQLIAEGADVNTCLGPGPPGDPKPLLWAIRPAKWTKGHRRALELLLDAGADPNGGQLTPLLHAAEMGHADAVELLIARGATVGFREAIAIGDLARVDAFLAEQPSLASAVSECGVGIHGRPGSSLHVAALSRMDAPSLATVAERLIAAGAPVEGAGDNSYSSPSPLKRAARSDNVAVAEVLLRHGADPTEALAEALMRDSRRVLALLAPRITNVDLPGDPKLANTLLDETIRFGLLASARWLIERGAPVDRPDNRGWTTLHYAASRGIAPDLVQMLLDRRASATAPDAEGRTPLDIAREGGKTKLVPLLGG